MRLFHMRLFRLLNILVVAAGVLLPRPARAQAPPMPPPMREGSAEFAFVGTAGNASTQTIGLGGELFYRPSPWETRLKINYVRNKAEDQLRAQSFVLTFRGQRPIRGRLAGFSQYGYQRDRFAGIVNRNVVDVGLAYAWLDETRQQLIVDGGVGYANEQRILGNTLSNATLGTGGIYTLKISATSDLSEDGHFVFSLKDGDDWRYVNTAALTAKVTTIVSLKLSNTVRYINAPVIGLKTTDVVTAIALVAKF